MTNHENISKLLGSYIESMQQIKDALDSCCGQDIYNLFKEGKIEEAEKAQESIASFRAVFKYGNPNTVVKKAVSMLGYPVGECRRPFNYLCAEGIEALQQVLSENKNKGMN